MTADAYSVSIIPSFASSLNEAPSLSLSPSFFLSLSRGCSHPTITTKWRELCSFQNNHIQQRKNEFSPRTLLHIPRILRMAGFPFTPARGLGLEKRKLTSKDKSPSLVLNQILSTEISSLLSFCCKGRFNT